jgi:hypothetical protein
MLPSAWPIQRAPTVDLQHLCTVSLAFALCDSVALNVLFLTASPRFALTPWPPRTQWHANCRGSGDMEQRWSYCYSSPGQAVWALGRCKPWRPYLKINPEPAPQPPAPRRTSRDIHGPCIEPLLSHCGSVRGIRALQRTWRPERQFLLRPAGVSCASATSCVPAVFGGLLGLL